MIILTTCAAAVLLILVLSITGGRANAAYSKSDVSVSGLGTHMAGKNLEFHAAVTGNSDAEIYDMTVKGDEGSSFNNSNLLVTIAEGRKSATGYITGSDLRSGKYILRIYLHGSEGYEELEYKFMVKPAAPSLKVSNIVTTYNTVSFQTGRWSYQNGEKIELYYVTEKEDGSLDPHYLTSFLTSSTVSTVSAKGLKPNTTYRLLAVGWSTALNDYGNLSKYVTVKTGPSKKPSIKSVKIIGAKVKKTRRYHSGHWTSTGTWIKGYYYTATSTSYKVTVKLNKKASGMKGIMINGTKVKGSGKTFKVTVTETGNQKGKKKTFRICSYHNNSYLGMSKSISKKAKVK